MGFNCLGEELNFLTTIFSRTLYHLSYRDLIFNFKNFKTPGAEPRYPQVREWPGPGGLFYRKIHEMNLSMPRAGA